MEDEDEEDKPLYASAKRGYLCLYSPVRCGGSVQDRRGEWSLTPLLAACPFWGLPSKYYQISHDGQAQRNEKDVFHWNTEVQGYILCSCQKANIYLYCTYSNTYNYQSWGGGRLFLWPTVWLNILLHLYDSISSLWNGDINIYMGWYLFHFRGLPWGLCTINTSWFWKWKWCTSLPCISMCTCAVGADFTNWSWEAEHMFIRPLCRPVQCIIAAIIVVSQYIAWMGIPIAWMSQVRIRCIHRGEGLSLQVHGVLPTEIPCSYFHVRKCTSVQ